MVVHLEVFTTWARRASPLHRYAPYWTGMVCVGVSGGSSRSPLCIVGVNLRNLQFGVPCVRSIRDQQSGSMVVHLEVFTKWARHASPLHRHAPYWTGMVCVGVSGRRSRSPLRIIGVNLRNLRFNSLSLEHSRSTIGVDGGSPGGLYEVGEACLAPTQICPRRERYGVCGRFRAPFPFAPAHSRRQSAKSAVRCSLSLGRSRSTIGVDGRSPGGLYEVGEACLAPTQTRPRRERYRVGVALHRRRCIRRRAQHDRRSSAQICVICGSICGSENPPALSTAPGRSRSGIACIQGLMS